MADIILNVSLKAPTLSKDAQNIANEIKSSLDKVPVNENLTKQLEALAKYYESVATAARNAKNQSANSAISEEKVAQAREKTREATAKADLVEQKLDDQRKKSIRTTDESTDANKKHEKSVLDMVKGFWQWQLAATLVMKPLQLIRSGIQDLGDTLVEVESDAVSLRRVLKDTFTDNSEITDEVFDLAIDMSREYKDADTIVQNFARSGMNFSDSIEASRAALLGMNVAELDASESSEGLISIMNQFDLEAGDLINIIDVFNKSADNSAVTTEKLLKALQRTGSSAKNANLTLEETTGIVTALSEATGRSGENLGTALNSLIQYSSKNSALETFANLSSDTAKAVSNYRAGAATILDVWRSVSKEIKTLTTEQADALDAYFNTAEGAELSSELSAELGEIYDELGGVYDTANTFRKNYFIALLNNMDQVDEAIATAQSAAGYSEKENEQYLETYEAKATALEAKWKKIANDEQGILGFKKSLVEVGDFLLDAVENAGGLTTVVAEVGAVSAISFGPAIIKNLKNFVSHLKAASAAGATLQRTVGIVAVSVTALTLLATAVDRYKDSIIEAHKEASEDAAELSDAVKNIRERYVESQGDVETLKTLQSELNDLVGEQAENIDLVNGKLDEQIKKLNQIAIEEAKVAEREAAQYVLGTEGPTSIFDGIFESGSLQYDEARYLYDRGIDIGGFDPNNENLSSTQIKSAIGYKSIDDFLKQYYNVYDVYKEKLLSGETTDALFKQLSDYVKAYEDIVSEYDSRRKSLDYAIKTQIQDSATAHLAEWLNTQSDLVGPPNMRQAVPYIVKALGIAEEDVATYERVINDIIDDWIAEANKATDNATDSTEKWTDALESASDRYEDIKNELQEILDIQKEEEELAERQKKLADARAKFEEEQRKAKQDAILESLRAERKEEEETVTLSEKQLAVEKARQALDDAKKQRRAYIYNAETGRFERQSVASAVQDAENDLQDAIDALNQYIEDQAWDSVIESVENGNTSLSGIEKLLAEWKTEYGGSEAVIQQILSAYKTGYGNADFSDAERNLADAEEEYQDYADQKLFDEVIDLLGSGEKITTEQAKELLKKYKGIGASDGAVQSVSRKLEEYTGTQLIYDSEELAEKYAPYMQTEYFGSRLASNAFTQAASNDFMPPYISYEPQAIDRIGIPTQSTAQSTVTNSNNDNRAYYINGVPVTQQDADSKTISEFCKNIHLIINN